MIKKLFIFMVMSGLLLCSLQLQPLIANTEMERIQVLKIIRITANKSKEYIIIIPTLTVYDLFLY